MAAGESLAEFFPLSVRDRFLQLLAAPATAPARDLVGTAQPPPQPANAQFLVGRPEPCAGRHDQLDVVRARYSGNRGAARAVCLAGSREPDGGEPRAR